MRMKLLTTCIAAFAFISLSFGQESRKITFEKLTHNFGEIDKLDPAEYTFSFTNTSEAPVKLSNVKASCGCTTPAWTREEVPPGGKGEIRVKYNTARIGSFRKSVAVTYSTEETPLVLYIEGKVNAPAPSAGGVQYQHVQGGLAFDLIETRIGTLDSDKEKKVSFHVKNISPIPLKVLDRLEVDEYVEVRTPVKELTPGQTSRVDLVVKGEKIKTPGAFATEVAFSTAEAQNGRKSFRISGNLNKVPTAEDLAQGPQIQFEQITYKAGKVIMGEKVDIAYAFTNTGKKDLVIESVKASCGCTASAPKDKVIKPGQRSEIMASFDSKNRRGLQKKSITVKTNDPQNPSVLLRLEVEVEDDPFHIGTQGPAAVPGPRSFNHN